VNQSFPPTNGVPAAGNLSANKSFGGFGNSSGGGGFGAFGGQNSTSGAKDGSVDGSNKPGSAITAGAPNFNFNPPSSSMFNFSSAQGSNPFAQPSTAAPSQPAAQPSIFNFGAPQQPTQPSQQTQQSSTPGLFNFGKPADATKPTKPAEKPAAASLFSVGQPAQTPSLAQQPLQSLSNSSASPSPAPETPPESSAPTADTDDTPKPNPFAQISLPPKPPANTSLFSSPQSKTPVTNSSKPSLFPSSGTSTKDAAQASSSIFSASKPGFSSPAKDTATPQSSNTNIFSMSASTPAFAQTETSTQSKEGSTKPSFASSPAKPIFSGTGTPATSTASDQPVKSTFGGFKPSATANETVPQSQQSKSFGPSASENLGFKSPWMTEDLLAEHITQYWIKKDKLPKDPKARTFAIRDLRLARLNNNMVDLIAEVQKSVTGKKENHCVDLRPMFSNYIQIYDAILSDGQNTLGSGSFNAPATATASIPSGISAGSTGMGGVQFSGTATTNAVPNSVSHSTTMFGSTKRKADEPDEDRAKRVKPSVPTPESTPKSDTAKKLQSFLDSSAEASKPAQSLFPPAPSTPPQNRQDAGSTPFKPSTSFNPSTTSAIDLSKAPASAPFKLFGSTANAANKPAESTTSGFKPSFGAPAAIGFKPTGVAASNNFLSQFGQTAAKTAEKTKKQAKDEDFDSDEDDEGEWEKDYEAKQKEKQKRFEEERAKLPPPPKFMPVPTAASKFSFLTDSDTNRSTNGDAITLSRSVSPAGSVLDGPKPLGPHLFSHLSPSDAGKDDEDDELEEQTPTINGTTTPSKPPPTVNRSLFDRIGKEKEEGSSLPADNPGDHTWKPSTPIKFGGPSNASSIGIFKFPTPNTANKPNLQPGSTGGLFGAKTPTVTVSGPSEPNTPALSATSFGNAKLADSLVPPSTTSSAIPSVTTSRASTPQLSELSDSGSAAADEDTAEESSSGSDLVNFQAAKEGHEVLFETHKVKVLKYDKEGSKGDSPWVTQGVGPIAVLKNDETNVISILMKAHPSGKVVINSRLNPSLEYKQMGKRARFVVPRNDGKMDSLLVQFAKEEDAKEFITCCEENKKR
jgi:RanBP1 domain